MTRITLDQLLSLEQYSLDDGTKDRALVELSKESIPGLLANVYLRSMFDKLGANPSDFSRMEDLPTLPVQMFKYYDLSANVGVSRVLRSSGTTSGMPSRVPLSKRTAMNQTKGLNSILKHFLGDRRRPFIVIDYPGVNDPKREITARGAGVRGLSLYSKETIYLLKEEGGHLVLDLEAVEKAKNLESAYVFGFTYIIWSVFMRQMDEKGIRMDLKGSVAFHSGGWKNLVNEKVAPSDFNDRLASIMGTKVKDIHDFYGMAEQTGAIFVECEMGHKHVPNFAQVIVRDPHSLEPLPPGQRGLIEVCSVLADSYYSNAILTEDMGMLTGVDDCPCGRKGRHFVVLGRVEKAEVRGCGDTFREGSR